MQSMSRNLGPVLAAWFAAFGWGWAAHAAEETENQHVGMYSPGLSAEWEKSLREKGLVQGANERDIYVAVGRKTVEFPPGHPGFHEARTVAFDIAYLRSKAELVRFLGSSIEQSNSYEALENAQWSDGQGEALERLKQTDRISRKLSDLAEVKLDQELAARDPKYDPDKYGSREEKEKAFRGAFRRQIREVASSSVSGAVPLEVLEGPVEDGNAYEILVGLVWSPRLELAARAVAGGYAPVRADEAGIDILDWLPQDSDSICASWGVHKMIDENGDQVFVGFGQAAPRKTSASRRTRAEEAALRRAELRAKGAIRGFVGEVVRSESSEEGEEISIEYADAAMSGALGSTFVEKLESNAKAITITGLTVVGQWVLGHSADNQRVAVVAVSWTPRGLATAKRVRDAMLAPDKRPSTEPAAESGDPSPKLLQKENIKTKDL